MSSFWVSVPKPSSRLARYRALSPNASIRVSPLQLRVGAAGIGDKWETFGCMDKASSFKLHERLGEISSTQPIISAYRTEAVPCLSFLSLTCLATLQPGSDL